jgi:hypothetical protein
MQLKPHPRRYLVYGKVGGGSNWHEYRRKKRDFSPIAVSSLLAFDSVWRSEWKTQ